MEQRIGSIIKSLQFLRIRIILMKSSRVTDVYGIHGVTELVGHRGGGPGDIRCPVFFHVECDHEYLPIGRFVFPKGRHIPDKDKEEVDWQVKAPDSQIHPPDNTSGN
jgi:hypothetical protein